MPERGAPGFGVGSWIDRRARTNPDSIALIAGDRSFSYAELAGRIRRLANALRGLGVARGDRVAWLGSNHPAFLESLFAANLLGAALAPVNHRLDQAEIVSVLDDTEPTVVIEHHTEAAPVPRSVRHRIAVAGSHDEGVDFEALVAESPDDAIEEPVGMDDLCLLPHTSGTTGRPKAVMLTHGNVTWNVVNLLSCADFRADDITVAIAPFFRVGGTGVNILPILFLGGTVVVPGETNADEILRLIQLHRVSVGFGNPDILDAMVRADRWQEADLSSVRFVLTGGAPVPERLIRTFLDRGVPLLQGYGLSEAAPFALLLDPGGALRKVGSAGRPPLFVDVRIEDPSGAEVEPGETGELLVRGPNVMAGYWRRPDATREVLSPDGWLRTGDAARADADGDIWIVDRVRDAFTTDGSRVYPGDVERTLQGHPAIADAAVVGAPAARGSTGAAFVVLVEGMHATDQELLMYCRERLSPHQVPSSVTFVDHLPRNSVGKLVRGRLLAHASGSARTGQP
jgi:acyl-CoA synthetase (AMP-forming)/AMP-acid ligase II